MQTVPVEYRLTRDTVLRGAVRSYLLKSDPSLQLRSDAEHRAEIRQLLRERPDGGGDVWLFAYGSLIWNPMVKFRERRICGVRGYHRRFCLWSHVGRGSSAAPGLVLGLEAGGICRGIAYRLAEAQARRELEIVWRREMITGAYLPRWIRIHGAGGRGWALSFVINRRHQQYAGLLPEDAVAEAIARARGRLGRCCDYLFDTAAHLEALGIADKGLDRIRGRVRQLVDRAS
jgi:cation transport protein ChaC